MRTLLINPPYPFQEFPIIPVGLLYLAGILEQRGYEVDVLDLLVSKYSKDKVKHKLEEYQPDIVGSTCVTMNYPGASEILKYCKLVNPDIIAVIGGPHVTFAPVETLNESPWIDIVVRGEGDYTLMDIVSGKKPENIQGIAYRSNGEIKLTPPRPLIEDLDSLPTPARHLFPVSRYLALASHGSIIAGRGCPFNCIFCVGSKMGGRRARFRNPKLVVDEIEQCLDLGFKEINLEDDLFTLNHKHLHAFCDEIINRGLKFNWSIFARVDTVNPEVLQKLRKAGCNWLSYGVESGNQEILDTVKKRITLDMVRKSVKMAKDAGIDVLISFILGLPGETKETMAQTLDFARELGTHYGFHVLAPFPGTEVRENADKYGLEILTNDWTKYDANRPVTQTQGAKPKDVIEMLHLYYRGIRYIGGLTSDQLTEEQLNQLKLDKTRKHGPLAWALVSGDVIETIGRIERKADPLQDLIERIAKLIPYSYQQITNNLTSWYNEGLLMYESKDNHVTWRWH